MNTEVKPGTVIYAKMLNTYPSMDPKAYKFNTAGDTMAITLGFLPKGYPMPDGRGLYELSLAVGFCTLQDVFEALGQKNLDVLISYLRDKFEGEK